MLLQGRISFHSRRSDRDTQPSIGNPTPLPRVSPFCVCACVCKCGGLCITDGLSTTGEASVVPPYAGGGAGRKAAPVIGEGRSLIESPMAVSDGGCPPFHLLPPVEGVRWLLGLANLLLLVNAADGYDVFDPNGNITIKWDVMQLTGTGYVERPSSAQAMVNIYNYQLYRHVERPGWKLEWKWPGDEVIWDVRGAEATEQGNCSNFRGQLPHSCLKKPVIVDLLPGTPYNNQVGNCCKGGVLSSVTQDASKSMASFQIDVGNAQYNPSQEWPMPTSFALGLPGYTCGQAVNATPSKFSSPDKRRKTQALRTWTVTCSYSQFRASTSPGCCVSLSTFYNNTIVECPHCSCGCQDSPSSTKCARYGEQAPVLQLSDDGLNPPPPFVRCTQHMCPIQIHWHVKVSYREYWRVKVTVTNYNLNHNYSEWNLVVNHPNLESLTRVFSFEHEHLHIYGPINDTVMFWGIPFYNDMLLRYGESGNVQTEMLLHKDPGIFTFKEGWAFPRRILFNGEDCVMPPPDVYPKLPNGCSKCPLRKSLILIVFPFLLFDMLIT